MKTRFLGVSWLLGSLLFAPPLLAQDEAVSDELQTQALPSSNLPFVAIAPCRLADTRDGTFPAGYGPPFLTAGGVRTFTFSGRCGIPAGVDAVAANLTAVNTLGAGFIATFPTGTAMPTPLVSSLNYSSTGQTVANAAIIAMGSGGQGNVVAGVSGADLIIDIVGYYPSVGIVTTINSMVGPITVASGPNISVTGSPGTLTIGASVPAGPTGATGSTGAIGPTGVTGPAGPTGPTGFIGPVGPTGATGGQGATGATGATGPNTYLNQACPSGRVLVGFDGSGAIICAPAARATCKKVAGIWWCYNQETCGQTCTEVCADMGLPFVIDDPTWFAAQDTVPECQAINDAFGLGGTVSMGAYWYACAEDQPAAHGSPGGMVGPLYCSTDPTCPSRSRTGVDQPGVACGGVSRRHLCPCQ